MQATEDALQSWVRDRLEGERDPVLRSVDEARSILE